MLIICRNFWNRLEDVKQEYWDVDAEEFLVFPAGVDYSPDDVDTTPQPLQSTKCEMSSQEGVQTTASLPRASNSLLFIIPLLVCLCILLVVALVGGLPVAKRLLKGRLHWVTRSPCVAVVFHRWTSSARESNDNDAHVALLQHLTADTPTSKFWRHTHFEVLMTPNSGFWLPINLADSWTASACLFGRLFKLHVNFAAPLRYRKIFPPCACITYRKSVLS